MAENTRYYIVATFELCEYGSRVISAELMTVSQIEACEDPAKSWVEGPYYGLESANEGLEQYRVNWVC